jgi:integrase
MQAKITQLFVQSITPREKIFRVNDTLLKGFTLIVRPSGKMTWVVDYRKPDGSRSDYKIGQAGIFTVVQARELAREFLAAIARGENPAEPEKKITLGDFMTNTYERWVMENRKSGKLTIAMIKSNFNTFFDKPLEDIDVALIEQWRSQKRKIDGVKYASLNRLVASLKSAINWSVKRGIIETNPLAKLEPLSERDSVKKVRYLTEAENERLMNALDKREKEMRDARDSHNKWLKAKKLKTVPQLNEGDFTDHLKPLVVLSLSTGIRRNSMLSLEWGDVNFADRTIMVRAATAKNEKQYYVPLSDIAFETLMRWHKQSKQPAPGSLVFPSPKTGEKMDNCNTAWENLLKEADIQNFRWHDMRHDFASQLVMGGVDLNTVRELMGHADLKMTLRYAHLAPENKLQAVKVLDKKRRVNALPSQSNADAITQSE